MRTLRRRSRSAKARGQARQPTPPRVPELALDLAVERFECIPVDDEQALLRISGEWGASEVAAEPELAVHVSGRTQLYKPLPGPGTAVPDGSGQVWQAGFAVPTSVITRRARFSLRAGVRSVTLPVPERNADLRSRPREADARAGEVGRGGGSARSPDISQVTAWWAEDAERHLAAVDRLREELDAERSARADLYVEAGRLRVAQAAVETDRAGLLEEVDQARDTQREYASDRAQLVLQIEALTARLSEAHSELRDAIGVIEQKEGDLTAQAERLAATTAREQSLAADLETRGAERDTLAQELEGQWAVRDELKAQRAAAEEELVDLRARIEEAVARSERLSNERAELEARLGAVSAERDELEARLGAVSEDRDELERVRAVAAAELVETRSRAEGLEARLAELEARLAATELESHERAARLDQVAIAMEQHEALVTELASAQAGLERDSKRIGELERRLDETLVAEEEARTTLSQLNALMSQREDEAFEAQRARDAAQEQVFELQEQLDEAREALRRGVRERLWELGP